jgi:hypothetical protein
MTRYTLPFAISLVANLTFSPIPLLMLNLSLACVGILIVLRTIQWMTLSMWPHHRWVTVARITYFGLGIDCHGGPTADHSLESVDSILLQLINSSTLSRLRPAASVIAIHVG